jgi:uncharacterized protein with GYD domain
MRTARSRNSWGYLPCLVMAPTSHESEPPGIPGRFIYVGLGNWTDQGTKDFRGSVQRGNGFRELVEQAGGRVRGVGLDLGEYDFITVLEAPHDETAATLVLRVAAAGNVRTKTMRAFDADQMSDIIARTG